MYNILEEDSKCLCNFSSMSLIFSKLCYYATARRKGGGRSKRWFCPSVAYIANNWRTRRPSVPKFGTKVLHHWCDSHTSLNVKRLKVKVIRPINAHTHRAPYLPNSKAYEFQTWYTDGERRPASATGAMTSNVKGQGRKVTWIVWEVLAQCCSLPVSLAAGGEIPCRPNPATTLLVLIYIHIIG